ncbi:hypothetical protein H4R19_004683 [Coemansia spiralis]|nr:hypothetical protein H4R19_004683 [Coemansia spiralis]
MSVYNTTHSDRYGRVVPAATVADPHSPRRERQRAHWSAEGDALFVSILAKHSTLDEREGLIASHRHIDPAIINDVSRGLTRHVAVEDLVQELAIKYPNKKDDGRSFDSISLIIEMKSRMPAFTHLQLNHKHINMWTRTVYPFCSLGRSGELFRGKSIFHKDHKRFIKVLMEFYSYVIINGLRDVDPGLFGRKAGRGTKLLEQWLTAMLRIHKQRMANFLYKCGIKLACLYIRSKPAAGRTPEESAFLESTSFTPKAVQAVLKEYTEQFSKRETAEQTEPYPDPDSADDCLAAASDGDDTSNVEVADVYAVDCSEPAPNHPCAPVQRQRQRSALLLRSVHGVSGPLRSPGAGHERPTVVPALPHTQQPLPRPSTYSPYARATPRYSYPMQSAPEAWARGRAAAMAAATRAPGPHTQPQTYHPDQHGSAGAYSMYRSSPPHALASSDGYMHPQVSPAAGGRQMATAQLPAHHGYVHNSRVSPRYQPYHTPQHAARPSHRVYAAAEEGFQHYPRAKWPQRPGQEYAPGYLAAQMSPDAAQRSAQRLAPIISSVPSGNSRAPSGLSLAHMGAAAGGPQSKSRSRSEPHLLAPAAPSHLRFPSSEEVAAKVTAACPLASILAPTDAAARQGSRCERQ